MREVSGVYDLCGVFQIWGGLGGNKVDHLSDPCYLKPLRGYRLCPKCMHDNGTEHRGQNNIANTTQNRWVILGGDRAISLASTESDFRSCLICNHRQSVDNPLDPASITSHAPSA